MTNYCTNGHLISITIPPYTTGDLILAFPGYRGRDIGLFIAYLEDTDNSTNNGTARTFTIYAAQPGYYSAKVRKGNALHFPIGRKDFFLPVCGTRKFFID